MGEGREQVGARLKSLAVRLSRLALEVRGAIRPLEGVTAGLASGADADLRSVAETLYDAACELLAGSIPLPEPPPVAPLLDYIEAGGAPRAAGTGDDGAMVEVRPGDTAADIMARRAAGELWEPDGRIHAPAGPEPSPDGSSKPARKPPERTFDVYLRRGVESPEHLGQLKARNLHQANMHAPQAFARDLAEMPGGYKLEVRPAVKAERERAAELAAAGAELERAAETEDAVAQSRVEAGEPEPARQGRRRKAAAGEVPRG